jgi:hypothetical protein
MAGNLRDKQIKFVYMMGELIMYARSQGIEFTLGDSYAKTGHRPKSLHYSRLAQDINLIVGDKYMPDTDDYAVLGRYWESIGGSWGGRFKDGSHFSLEHEGRK